MSYLVEDSELGFPSVRSREFFEEKRKRSFILHLRSPLL